MTSTIQTIYSVLQHGPRSVPELRKVVGKGDNYVRACLSRLADDGKVRRSQPTRVQRMGRPPSLWERIA